ncbi:hypothetical protein LCGC14_1704740, partial [marine sediment metagenome]
MTESTLSLNWSDLLNDVGFYLGWGRETSPGTAVDVDNLTKWTTEQYERINEAVKVGLRQLYYPPKLKDDVPAHSWTYLTPTTSITTWLTFTGTLTQAVASSDDSTTIVTDSTAPFFQSVVGHNMASSIDGSSGSYE